jgi:hypothetical protein
MDGKAAHTHQATVTTPAFGAVQCDGLSKLMSTFTPEGGVAGLSVQ